MSRRSSHLLIMSLLCSPVLIKAQQSVIKLTDSLITELRKSNREPIIRFSFSYLYVHPVLRYQSDTSKEFHIYNMEYIVYKKNKNTYTRKIVEHFTEDASDLQEAISESINFDDSLYHWLNANTSSIRREQMLPFEYYSPAKDSLMLLEPSHPFPIEIGIYSSREHFEKIITDYHIEKWMHYYRNLNFEANSKTTLYLFYHKLNDYFGSRDHQFKFVNYKSK